MTALVVGLSHHSAPVDVLEQAAIGPDAVGKLLDDVHSAEHVSEAVAVVTCNRVELYADVATFHGGVDDVSVLLARHIQADLAELTSHLYVHYDDAAVSHLFHVASGLDSMVVGESQILGQVREAFRAAQAAETVGRNLGALFPAALRVGKRCHAETGIDSAGRSVVTVGLAAVAPEGVSGLRALVVGAGSMAALAASTLIRAEADVTVTSRSAERAAQLARSVGGHAIDLGRLSTALRQVDVVVSCTGAAGVVLTADLVESAMRERSGRTLRVLDVALPHDVDLAVHAMPGVVIADLATLANRRDLPAPATEDVTAARTIVAEELVAFAGARRQAQVAPTVVALRAMADEVVAGELARMAAKLPELDARSLEEITKTVRRVVDKLLHAPTVRIKELGTQPGGGSYESALRELFALDPRTVEAVVRPVLDTDSGDER